MDAAAAAANVFDALLGHGLADLRRTPACIIDEGPKRAVYRYLAHEDRAQHALPVLLVPPLAGPTACFDLRRGCSLAEHLLALGHPTYLLEYGDIAFSDRDLGLEHWVDEIIPTAVRRVSEDAGGVPVALVGWCLGGIMSLLALAATRRCRSTRSRWWPARSTSRQVRIMAPMRPLAGVADGLLARAVPRARRRAGAGRQARLPARLDRQVPDDARSRCSRISTTASSWPRCEAVDRFVPTCTPIPVARWASSTTASSASTSSPAGASRSPIASSTWPTSASPSSRSPGETCWRRARRSTTWRRCCPTRRPCAWRPRPAGTSACSRAARPAHTTWAWLDAFLAATRAARAPAQRRLRRDRLSPALP